MESRQMDGSLSDPRPPEAGLPLEASLRILLVEDNLINQKVAVQILQKNGHRVVVAGDGQQALDALDGGAFDLVLMDLQMPVMDGFEATAAIRMRDRPDSRMPVIAVTANALQGDRQRCLDAGFDDYVSKPIRWPLLKAAIDNRPSQSPEFEVTRPPVDDPELAS
jgi:two-component system sensor histidine kinase/response regulator